MTQQKTIEKPVFHALKFHTGSYAKVYWPLHKKQGSTSDRTYVAITNNSEYTRPNGSIIQVKSIFEGKLYPMVSYTIDNGKQVCSTSLAWFAYNIANC
jgi:hypothetical protein